MHARPGQQLARGRRGRRARRGRATRRASRSQPPSSAVFFLCGADVPDDIAELERAARRHRAGRERRRRQRHVRAPSRRHRPARRGRRDLRLGDQLRRPRGERPRRALPVARLGDRRLGRRRHARARGDLPCGARRGRPRRADLARRRDLRPLRAARRSQRSAQPFTTGACRHRGSAKLAPLVLAAAAAGRCGRGEPRRAAGRRDRR